MSAKLLYQSKFDPPRVANVPSKWGFEEPYLPGRRTSQIRVLDLIADPVRQRYFNRIGYNGKTTSSGTPFSSANLNMPDGLVNGNCVLVAVTAVNNSADPGAITVTDDAGNSYTQAKVIYDSTGFTKIAIFYAINVNAASNSHIQAACANNANVISISAATYDVYGNNIYLDATASGSAASGSPVTTGSYSNTYSDELVFAAASAANTGGTFTSDKDYVVLCMDTGGKQAIADRVPNSTLSGATATFTYSTTGESIAVLASFKLVPATVTIFGYSGPELFAPVKKKYSNYQNVFEPTTIVPSVPAVWGFEGQPYFVRKPIRQYTSEHEPIVVASPATGILFGANAAEYFRRNVRRTESVEFNPNFIPSIPFSDSVGPDYFARLLKRQESERFEPTTVVPPVPRFFEFDGPIYIRRKRTPSTGLGSADTPAQGGLTGRFQVTDGYPIVIEPSLTTAVYEEVIDYGTILTNNILSISWSVQPIVGSVSIVSKIAFSNDNITYSAFTTGTSAFASSLRYAKIRIEFTGADDKSLIYFSNLQTTLNVKREIDSGTVDCFAADVTGTPVLFNKSFKDIDSITVTALSTTTIITIYDFVDIPNPTGFSIYAFDLVGNRVNATVSWKARGVV